MKFVLDLSLERFVLVKIVAALWNVSDVRDSMAKFRSQFSEVDRLRMWQKTEMEIIKKEEWQKMEARVMGKVPQLPLPDALKEKIENFIRPVGLQIFKLLIYYCEGRDLENLPLELHWTPQGTIDRKETAQKLIENDNLDITVRFKLACTFCLENSISELWKKMSEKLRETFSHTWVAIHKFWRNKMVAKARLMKYEILSNQYLFEYGAEQGNKAIVEYFLPILTARERKQSLVKAAKKVSDADVLCFLLSQMDEDQQIEIFKNDPYGILRCFLSWPFQSFFIEVAEHMWFFLCLCNFTVLLQNIVSKIQLGFKDWNYQKLFEQFWQNGPSAFKINFTEDCIYTNILGCLLQIKDKQNFKLIFQDLTHIERNTILNCPKMENICECLFYEGDWEFLGFIFQTCLPSKGEKQKFKNKFEMRPGIKSYLRLPVIKQEWNQLFPSLPSKSVRQSTKRKHAAGKGKVKRLRRIQS